MSILFTFQSLRISEKFCSLIVSASALQLTHSFILCILSNCNFEGFALLSQPTNGRVFFIPLIETWQLLELRPI